MKNIKKDDCIDSPGRPGICHVKVDDVGHYVSSDSKFKYMFELMSQVDITTISSPSVAHRDEVLAQLFRNCRSLLRYDGVLVDTDDKG